MNQSGPTGSWEEVTMKELETLVRENVLRLTPYSSARQEFTGDGAIMLDANENPFRSELNRYPDPLQRSLKSALGEYRGIAPENILLGNGSDEVLDLIFRAFCEPGADRVLLFPPTYGMYRVIAGMNDVEVCEGRCGEDFQPDMSDALRILHDVEPKLVMLCSPNNPTGNLIDRAVIESILQNAPGLVVLDEAYIDFSPGASWLPELDRWPNLIVVQTFSKAWGMAGGRLGVGYASAGIIDILNRIRYPYNVNSCTQRLVLDRLGDGRLVQGEVSALIRERGFLTEKLRGYPSVEQVYPSEANFLLIRVDDPDALYANLLGNGIVIRNVSRAVPGCVRITIGTPDENRRLLAAFDSIPGGLS